MVEKLRIVHMRAIFSNTEKKIDIIIDDTTSKKIF